MWTQVNELLLNKYICTHPITLLHNLCPVQTNFHSSKRQVDGWLAKGLVTHVPVFWNLSVKINPNKSGMNNICWIIKFSHASYDGGKFWDQFNSSLCSIIYDHYHVNKLLSFLVSWLLCPLLNWFSKLICIDAKNTEQCVRFRSY